MVSFFSNINTLLLITNNMKFFHMHENRLKVDKKGRVLIPSHIRKKLCIDNFIELEHDNAFNRNIINIKRGETGEKKDSNSS